MIVHTVDILHVEHLIGSNLYIPASMQHPRCINAQFDSLKTIERLLAGLYRLYGGLVETVDVYVNIVMVRNIESPAFKPFYVDQISNVLLLLTIVDLIPFVETSNQLLLHLFLSKNIEDLPEFAEVDDSEGLPQPHLHGKTLFAHQMMVDLTCFLNFPLIIQFQVSLIGLQHELEVGIVQTQLKGMIKHDEHDEGQGLLWAEVEDGDHRKEVVPVHIPIILEIENFIQPINLLLRISLQLRKELFKTVEL